MAIDQSDGYNELQAHIGHDVHCRADGEDDRGPKNVVIDCVTCCEVLYSYERPLMKVDELDVAAGDRIRLTRQVERFPHFIAPKGATGTINDLSGDAISCHMDENIEGAEDWDNDLVWADCQLNEFRSDTESA